MSRELVQHRSAKATVIEPSSEIFNTRSVVNKLEALMSRVTEKECTPETVNAACNCADKIVDMLRLHLDVQRLDRKLPRVSQ